MNSLEMDYKAVGERIAYRRRALKLKQSEVEERAELSYKYLSNIERGISIPSTEVIMRLALALDTTPDAFLVGTTKQPTDRYNRITQLLQSLTPAQLSMTEEIIEVIARQKG